MPNIAIGYVNHSWEVGDVFRDKDRNIYIIRSVNDQENFWVCDLNDQSDHGWYVDYDTFYVGHINPRPSEGEITMWGQEYYHTVNFEKSTYSTLSESKNNIAEDLAKIK